MFHPLYILFRKLKKTQSTVKIVCLVFEGFTDLIMAEKFLKNCDYLVPREYKRTMFVVATAAVVVIVVVTVKPER